MLFSVVGIAQKDEIKTADKALKSGDAMAAKTALDGASSLIGSADEKMQAQYYFLKGKRLCRIGKKRNRGCF